ncbi:MAG TPA: PQQ-binding-like beta-propeller repeat protein, partial [Rhizomicrobium sp.]|nr:PQQ-binding-like beta-propeller repeat protein [Rhizomicrobium sp.]
MKALLKGAAACAAWAAMAGAASAAGSDWPVSGHDAGGQRYSPLSQINKSNVSNLQIAWTYHMTPAGYSGRPRLVEAIPTVIGNTMYVSSSYGEVIALNATTGAEVWKYKLPDTDIPTARGVAYWKGAKSAPATIVTGSRLGRLYALDAKTGKPVESFGEHGIVNLKTPEVMGNSPNYPYGQPAVPVIYKDLIITGAGTPDAAPNTGAKGDTRAWDAK